MSHPLSRRVNPGCILLQLKSLQKKITHLKASPAGQDLYADSRVNHLQQRLEELRRLQAPLPSGHIPAAAHEEALEEEDEGSQSDEAAPVQEMQVESEQVVREDPDAEAEERACFVLVGLRSGAAGTFFPQWQPSALPNPSQTQFEVGLKAKPASRAESPPGSRGGSSSSGVTMPSASPRLQAEERPRSAIIECIQVNQVQAR